MAPAVLPRFPSGEHIRQVSRSISSSVLSRSTDSSQKIPLVSVFAIIVRGSSNLASRAAPLISRAHSTDDVFLPLSLEKRQNAILAIPTTYQGLNAGPPPGTVVGITLGAIGGFIIILYIVLTTARLVTGGTIVQEEIITRRSRSHSRRSEMSERRPRRRRETVVEERVERVSRPASIVVEEEEDDIVEVIEEHSPERSPTPPRRGNSRRVSGYRTVDPAELGGGGRPMRKLSKR